MHCNRRSLSFLVLGLSLAAGAACGGATPEPAAPGGPTAPEGSGSTAPASTKTSWTKDMTKDQQVAFMKARVMPAMGPVFQTANATKYADFSCKTCHGPAYKDPHEYLPHLTMKDGKLTAFAEKPEVAKFMAESVTPKMAAAMGQPPYDMTTHQGFGCGGCHTIDTK